MFPFSSTLLADLLAAPVTWVYAGLGVGLLDLLIHLTHKTLLDLLMDPLKDPAGVILHILATIVIAGVIISFSWMYYRPGLWALVQADAKHLALHSDCDTRPSSAIFLLFITYMLRQLDRTNEAPKTYQMP